MLAMNTDNTDANDTQTTVLAKLNNSFKENQRAQCFNHTIQLSAKALLLPFNLALGKVTEEAVVDNDNDNDMLDLEALDNDDGNDDDAEECADVDDDADDGVDELDELDDAEREELLEGTAVVRGTVQKVRH
jgi:hypothetical protein